MYRHLLFTRLSAAFALLLTLHYSAYANSLVPGTLAQDAAPSGIHIVVLVGDKGVNILNSKAAIPPVVEVLDSHDRPVAGAAVTFTAPDTGASVMLNNSRSATVITEADGKATPTHVTPVGAGDFQYQITALLHDQRASAVVDQSNSASSSSTPATTGASGATPQNSHKIWWVVGGLAAAAAVGAGVGLAGRSGSGTPSTTPTAVIGAGNGPSVGAPH